MKFADLHLHTVFSDGTYTPEELIREAFSLGLSAVAVVDHDTVAGIAQVCQAGLLSGIEVLPGIELTAEYKSREIHILGYLIDYKSKSLIEKLDVLYKNRFERVYKIIDKLKTVGVSLEAKSVFDIVKQGTPGRLHIARAMVKDGLVSSIGQAFYKYIGDKSGAYVLGFKLSPGEAIKLIKDAGGVPVLAHPYSAKCDEFIPQLVDFGLMGLEVYYPEHSQAMINFYLGLAKKFNLLATGGSDCHGDAKPEVKIGSVKIPYNLVEELKAAKQKMK